MPVIPCPYLGLDDDQTVSRTSASSAHRCYPRRPPAVVDAETQTELCLSGRYVECQFCPETARSGAPQGSLAVPAVWGQQAPASELPPPKWAVKAEAARSAPAWGAALPVETGKPLQAAAAEEDSPAGRRHRWLWLLLPVLTIIVFGALFAVVGREWLQPPAATPPVLAEAETLSAVPARGVAVLSAAATAATDTAEADSAATAPGSAPVSSATPVPLASPTGGSLAAVEPPDRFVTPTPVAGGAVATLNPAAGQVGWWASDEQRGHLADSFLYAGRYAGKEFLSAARFDLSGIPRGAVLEQVVLRLTGLNGGRLAAAPDADTIWLVQLVGEAGAAELERSDYVAALSAPAAITLPPLRADMLAAGQSNTFDLDAASRTWLQDQLLDGAASVVVRFIASGGSGDTLFAWDSGQGPESAGNGPGLLISYGPPPPTPPPLPTKPFVVATLTPVPENALTVVAQAATATAQATAIGTATELPYQVYTPTPFPENLATVQAVAAIRGLPAVLLLTPTPANAATATEQAAYATAVALTTGTFTPVPTGFVTPIIVPPSPPAQNVATAAAQVLAATASAQAPSANSLLATPTPTPLPFSAVLGVYVYATPVFVPQNEATAVAYNRQLNDAILATGTPTPLPWNAIIITVVPTPAPPTPTPIPLFIPAGDLTATPSPTPTGTPPSELPAEVRGKILFKSDRGGAEAVYMLDPATGAVTLITQPWVFALAQERLSYSADGANHALVQQDDNRKLQIFNESIQYGTVRKVTALGGDNYDPAWSPTGQWIAFVSTETGGDEIYRVDPTGAVAQRLTNNTWEWDKHPTWSPDGGQIVFFSNRDSGRRQLWIMDADGGNQRNLSSNEYNDWDPIWVW